MRIDRRRALAILGLGAATSPAMAADLYKGPVDFNHGVGSGDPLANQVILWTRITAQEPTVAEIAYSWTITPAAGGKALTGTGVTGPGRDYTVKIDVAGLVPATDYVFSFEANGTSSPKGQTRTLPVGKTKEVVMAVASCSLYPNGYFNAYGAIAALDKVDVVIHLGDYIYEYGGADSYGMDSPVAAKRAPKPNRHIVSLADYRERHAQYKSDPQLQAAHARAPWVVVWDDHETANNSYADGAENHHPKFQGSWVERKVAAVRAYYEWMPIREPANGGAAINRTFQFGDLASLIMLETRLTARMLMLDYSTDLNGADGKPDIEGLKVKIADPNRKMLGLNQEAWLAGELKTSVQSGQTWQVLGNEVVMAKVMVPSFKKELGPERYAQIREATGPAGRQRMDRMDRIGDQNLPYGLDMWDGYPVERERVYGIFKETKAHPVVLAGDSHAFWANELHDDAGERRAVEFGTTSITSPGGGDALKGVPIGEVYAQANRDIVYNEQAAKGFVLLTLNHKGGRADMVAVSTIVEENYTTSVIKSFTFKPERGGVSALKTKA